MCIHAIFIYECGLPDGIDCIGRGVGGCVMEGRVPSGIPPIHAILRACRVYYARVGSREFRQATGEQSMVQTYTNIQLLYSRRRNLAAWLHARAQI